MSIPRVLIAYDGSPNSRTAVEAAATLFPGAEAVIFFARQPMEGFAAHLQGHPVLERLEGVDAALLDASEQVAAAGAELARALGLRAEPLVSSSVVSASEAIIAAAEERDSTLIVLGSRGRRGLAATVLGSTSANVLHHATRPTLVIPSDAVAAARSATPRD
ncbi:universal stress protein [Microbacterium sp. p3-SID338]|uniref:universal stress protein n=1 Tax=unclassified Microbacterium TaxID=2609290 RepID=UPI0007890CAC|nr:MULTISPECIES: universal stress protein [unclassified Microbacterium]KYJ97955.1 universal stress protein UspA [Microbacterium sp. CH1]MCT1396927.1 universal stress protein [Microbacterium sp. p3-SID338]PMC04410.1 universal stress protein [Microbacterium sp. UMB0228]